MNIEEQLVEQFFARDERVLARVEDCYGAYCRSIAQNILQNATEAQDCATDTYMHAWNHIPPERPKNLLAYLARIARNLAIDLYRHKKAEKRSLHMETLLEEIEECIPSGDADIADSLALRDALNTFLAATPRLARCVFVRRYFYASTISEIAHEYDLTDSAVKTSLHRTRRDLKNYLIEKGIQV